VADKNLKRLGFTPCKTDPCIYRRPNADGTMFYLALYVDNILYVNNDRDQIKAILQLAANWDMKWLGDANQFLGIRMHRDREKRVIHLSQPMIIQEALADINMTYCNPVRAPTDPNLKLQKATVNSRLLSQNDSQLYHTIVGKLLYVACHTRLDLSYITSQLGSYVASPTQDHLEALKKVIRYCKGTVNHGILLGKESAIYPVLSGYSDADWASDTDTRKSRTGYVFLLNAAYHGNLRSNRLLHYQHQRPNIWHSPTQEKK
jgi:hypothetical protein